MGTNLNQRLFSAADNLRSKMDASEYKDYLLGLIFYKYLSDQLLEKVVELSGESLSEYNTLEKQENLYRNFIKDESTKDDLLSTLRDTIQYDIEPDFLFHNLANMAKKNLFQLNDLNKGFVYLSSNFEQFEGLFDDIDLYSRKLGQDDQQRNITITEVIKQLDEVDVLSHDGDVIGDAYEFLISQFASDAGKKAGEFYTPKMVSKMMARIVTLDCEEKKIFSVFDATMGSRVIIMITADSNDGDWLSSPLLENKNMDWCAF